MIGIWKTAAGGVSFIQAPGFRFSIDDDGEAASLALGDSQFFISIEDGLLVCVEIAGDAARLPDPNQELTVLREEVAILRETLAGRAPQTIMGMPLAEAFGVLRDHLRRRETPPPTDQTAR